MGYEREKPLRARTIELGNKRDAMELEMNTIVSNLTADGQPGLTGNLVDAQGFPRADIDILAVRTQRNRLAVLKTDHKEISDEIEALLHVALAPQPDGADGAAAGVSEGGSSTAAASGSVDEPEKAEVSQEAITRRPFAVVDIVSPNSPAEEAGLRVGDSILSFGAVCLHAMRSAQASMQALPGLLSSHENRAVDVDVLRNGEVVRLSLTPKRWSGNGMLGCHIVAVAVQQVDEHYAPEVATAVMLHGGEPQTGPQ